MASGSTPPSSFSAVASPVTSAGKYGYSRNILGYAWTNSQYTSGQVWNSTPGNNSTLIRYVSLGSTSLTSGNVIQVTSVGEINVMVSSDTSPTTSGAYVTKYVNSTNYHYFVAGSGVSNKQEVFPNEHGVIVLPINTQYVIVTCQLTNLASAVSSGNLWYVNTKVYVSTELPEDQNEVAAINDQTETFMDTTGSDTVGGDALTEGQQIAQNISFVQQTGQFVTGTFDAFANASPSSGLYFPGLTIMGHQIIAPQNVSFLGYLGTDLENQIKHFVTLVIFLAWINGLRGLYHKIFLGEQEVEVVDE